VTAVAQCLEPIRHNIIFQVNYLQGKQDDFYTFISQEQMTVLCRDKLEDTPGILMDENEVANCTIQELACKDANRVRNSLLLRN
jgi:hypothetical protein